jgi:hypothetical protein
MDQKQIAKQMIQFNKSALDNSFKAMTMVCEQNEKMVETMLEQSSWLPENGRKAIQDWVTGFKAGSDDFKKMFDSNYAKVEAFFGEG